MHAARISTFRTSFLGTRLHVQRIGTDGSVAQAAKLLRHWSGSADAIGLGLVADSGDLGAARARRGNAARLRALATQAPLSTGARLADIFLEWAVRHAQSTLGHCFDNAKVLFFSGLAHAKLAATMAEYSENLQFADPLLQLGVPKLLTSVDALNLYASGAHYVADWAPPRVLPGGAVRGSGRTTCCARPWRMPASSWRRCTSSTALAPRSSPARRSSRPRSTTNAWRSSGKRACTW